MEKRVIMTAFHTIAIPHDDILQGRLTMDRFMSGRERIQEEVEKEGRQEKLL